MTTRRQRPNSAEVEPAPAGDPWLEALRRALVPIEPVAPGTPPLPEDQRAQAARAAERATKDLGTGIDPAPVLAGLERLAAALRQDPGCVEAYLGIGKAVQLLALKRPPRQADDLYSAAIDWLARASARLAPVQGSAAIHALDARLRELRGVVRARPRADAEVESDVVRLERDREGRVRADTRRAPRFRPPSEVLRSLLSRTSDDPAAGGEPQQFARSAATRAVVIAAALGLLLAAVVGLAVSADDERRPAWPDPALAARVQEALAAARPLLVVDGPLAGEPPAPAAVVADGPGAALPDPLHAVLPDGVAATGGEVRCVVVVRRYEGPAGNLLLLWVVDLELPARVVARATFGGRGATMLDAQARAWLASMVWRK